MLVLIYFFVWNKKIKKRINRGPSRVGGVCKQCKNPTKINPYFIIFVIGFYGTLGLKNLLITRDKDGLMNISNYSLYTTHLTEKKRNYKQQVETMIKRFYKKKKILRQIYSSLPTDSCPWRTVQHRLSLPNITFLTFAKSVPKKFMF